ncbi:hypothetical protein CYMTET_34350, partial [Cymbomonas tetramitiformis]
LHPDMCSPCDHAESGSMARVREEGGPARLQRQRGRADYSSWHGQREGVAGTADPSTPRWNSRLCDRNLRVHCAGLHSPPAHV